MRQTTLEFQLIGPRGVLDKGKTFIQYVYLWFLIVERSENVINPPTMPDWAVSISSPTMSISLTRFSPSGSFSGSSFHFAFSAFSTREGPVSKEPGDPHQPANHFRSRLNSIKVASQLTAGRMQSRVLKSINAVIRNLLLDVVFSFSRLRACRQIDLRHMRIPEYRESRLP